MMPIDEIQFDFGVFCLLIGRSNNFQRKKVMEHSSMVCSWMDVNGTLPKWS